MDEKLVKRFTVGMPGGGYLIVTAHDWRVLGDELVLKRDGVVIAMFKNWTYFATDEVEERA